MKKLKLLVGFTFAFLVIVQHSYLTPTIVKSNAQNQSTYTITSDDGYYAQTTYYLTEQAYQDYLDNVNSSVNLSAQTTNATSKNANAMDDEVEFVLAAVQTVCVYEQADNDGIVTESRLLTGEEIEVFRTSVNTVSTYSVIDDTIISDNDIIYPDDTIGSDNESLYYLDIGMTVKYNSGTGQYIITGTASWKEEIVWPWESNKAAEEKYFDYLGITWGGDKDIIAHSHTITGNYYNGDSVSFAKQLSDSYVGYVWQFNEKSGYLGKEMEEATATVNISKYGASQNKETNAKLTYIHTYGVIEGNVSFTYGADGNAAAELSLSETEKQWQIQIDISGIAY